MTGSGGDLEATEGWNATVEHREDVVTDVAAGALHDLLDRDGERPGTGRALPLLWHWLAFLPRAGQRDLGADGHPRTGSFLPPTHGRSRMYAGGRVTRRGTIRVGQRIARRSTVTQVARKRGRAGELMLVTVEHRIDPAQATADVGIHEEQDLVYRSGVLASASREATGHVADGDGWTWAREVPIEPTLLFRFSALTYNAHRIHYDRDYATGQEGYPGLVVHGPLQAVLLADAVERAHPHHFVSSLAFRATAPAFDDHPLRIRLAATANDDGMTQVGACAFSGPRQTMSATAILHLETGTVP
jgi:3-methylfumaryl-CoA hydratase